MLNVLERVHAYLQLAHAGVGMDTQASTVVDVTLASTCQVRWTILHTESSTMPGSAVLHCIVFVQVVTAS